ncbi:unnamed protein product [Orchesella dallaii]|uniref:Uncharacterized protein n=1 Tax=Orchesella dallaii TaxID=48710 RepID=A0ABP1RY39_9HEXA
MKDWQKKQIRQNLERLIKLTSCNIELLSKLTSFLSEDDEATLEAKLKSDGILAHAALFYRIAIIKAGMYEALTKALLQTKQTAPFQILLEGTIKNHANINLEGIPEEILLNALNGFHKNAVAGVVTFQGQQLKLQEVLEIFDESSVENFATKHLNGKLLIEIISNKKPALVNNGVPDQLSYFIDRK